MTDADVTHLMRLLFKKQRRETIRALLAGNDTQCFTSQQYVDTYNRMHCEGKPIAYLGMVRKVLAEVCDEVKPDVWTNKPKT